MPASEVVWWLSELQQYCQTVTRNHMQLLFGEGWAFRVARRGKVVSLRTWLFLPLSFLLEEHKSFWFIIGYIFSHTVQLKQKEMKWNLNVPRPKILKRLIGMIKRNAIVWSMYYMLRLIQITLKCSISF